MLRERMLKAALMHSVATPQSPTQIPTISQPVETMRDASYCAAKAVVGGRFANESIALKASEFRCADLGFVKIYVKRLQQNDQAVRLCKEEEEVRRKRLLMERLAVYPEEVRTNFDFQEAQFNDLLRRYGSDKALSMTDEVRDRYAWIFENTAAYDKRYYAWHFQYAVLADVAKKTEDGHFAGAAVLHVIATTIFGSCAYCHRSIANAVKEERPEQPVVGRPVSFPREAEAVLFRFVSCCRKHNIATYKSTIIQHGQRVLDGTEAALSFVQVVDGEYVADDEGHLMWDQVKWDHWFYRRFWGDRRADGASTGNQNILDIHRAKWHSFEAMEPYFYTHVRALVDEGICTYNKLYDENDKDDKGVPKQPIAFWIEGERWRAFSFDETRLDDKTHGDGANRKGRTERTFRAGKWDEGVCIGQKVGIPHGVARRGLECAGRATPPFRGYSVELRTDNRDAAGGPRCHRERQTDRHDGHGKQ